MPLTAERPHVRVVMGGLMLVMLLASLDQTIVSTALPTIVRDLGGLEHISWVVTAYLLAVTVVTPLYGKLGDLYGRKIVLQAALILFLIGSALCGTANGMTELIVFRGIQGLGGGGLMVSAQAAIGDVVPPSQRGRYTGLFGAVFGVSAVAGPLLGGFITTHTSWRWIFYVNLPLGILAFGTIAATLPSVAERHRHVIDWAGTVLLGIGLSAIVLLTTLGGNTYDWVSPEIIGMGIIGVLALVGFWHVEQHASEPILPPSLFRNRVFVICGAVSMIVGFALFGALTYLPLFQQVVRGLSPTASGLQLLPVMVGLLLSSIASGQIIARTGRYKIFPVLGTAIAALGMWLLSSLDASTPTGVAALHMFVLGIGLGMVMQVLVLATQNAVSYEQLGVATSGATLFRSIGGSLGTALLGAVFQARLQSGIEAGLTQNAAFTDAIQLVFTVATYVVAGAFVLTWFIPERPLRATVETSVGVGESLGAPVDTDSLRELVRGLSRLVGRERTLRFVQGAAGRAGLDIAPGVAWFLLREPDPDEIPDIRTMPHVDEEAFDAAAAEARERAWYDDSGITDSGRAVRNKLVVARTDCLRELIDDWQPNGNAEIDAMLERLAQELAPPPSEERELSIPR
jgi:EmrB/QacA subfamily drug resistance transporter